MRLLVFDTETTGLPKGYPSIYKTDLWPHIVQLSYILYDTSKNKILVENDHIIKLPKSVELPEESTKIHGVTREMTKHGVDIKHAIALFNICLEATDIVVAHNMSFDKQLFIVECIRNNVRSQFTKQTRCYCTMRESVDMCNIKAISQKNNEEYKKFPTLTELHKHLFDIEPKGVHNALVDILICLRCYIKMTQGKDMCVSNARVRRMFKKYGI